MRRRHILQNERLEKRAKKGNDGAASSHSCTEKMKFQCHICGLGFETQKGLNMHRTKSASTHDLQKGAPYVTCNVCLGGTLRLPAHFLPAHNRRIHSGSNESDTTLETVGDGDVGDGGDAPEFLIPSFEGPRPAFVGFSGSIPCFGTVDIACTTEEDSFATFTSSEPGSSTTSHVTEVEIGLLRIVTKAHVVISDSVANDFICWANTFLIEPVRGTKIRPIKKLKQIATEEFLFQESQRLKRVPRFIGFFYGTRTLTYTLRDKCGNDSPVKFRIRNLATVILEIIHRSQVYSRGLQMDFHKTINKDDCTREYGELWTGKDWERKEKRLQRLFKDSKILYCILYIDETTRRTGGSHAKTYTPLLLTLGNIPLDTRSQDCAKSLLGFVPRLKGFDPVTKHQVLQQFLRDFVVSQFKELLQVNGFELKIRNIEGEEIEIRAVPCIGLILGDRPMRCAMVCVRSQWDGAHPCPNCTMPSQHLDTMNISTIETMQSIIERAQTSEESEDTESDGADDVLSENDSPGADDSDLSSGDSFGEADEDNNPTGNDETPSSARLRENVPLIDIKNTVKHCIDTGDTDFFHLKKMYGIYPVQCAFWDSPLLENPTEVYSMVPADMLHDFDLGTIKDALSRLLLVIKDSHKKFRRNINLQRCKRKIAERCSRVPNFSYFEYDDAGKEHRKDLRRFPEGFWEQRDKSWGASDYRAQLAQVFIGIGDDDSVLARSQFYRVRKALHAIMEVTLLLRETVPMSEKRIDHLMHSLNSMSTCIKNAFIKHRPSKYKHPKFHTKVHYGHWVRLYGYFGNFSTESFESWFKAGIKDASQLGNQKTDGWDAIKMRLQVKEVCQSQEVVLKGTRESIGCFLSCECIPCLSGDCKGCEREQDCLNPVNLEATHVRCTLTRGEDVSMISNAAGVFASCLQSVYDKKLKCYFAKCGFSCTEFQFLMCTRLFAKFGINPDAITSINTRAVLHTFKGRDLLKRSFIHCDGKDGYGWIEIAHTPEPGSNDDDEWYARALMLFSCENNRHFCAVHSLYLVRNNSRFPHRMFHLTQFNGCDIIETKSIERQVLMVPVQAEPSEQFYLLENPMF